MAPAIVKPKKPPPKRHASTMAILDVRLDISHFSATNAKQLDNNVDVPPEIPEINEQTNKTINPFEMIDTFVHIEKITDHIVFGEDC
ncbi:hypothetical protein QR98_0079920 [Sarcoptes scabiei]|uniref:Uncharacterized protein n=1 Tax=Sarcoptes scabiei TaxID=52283 RepID=A0A132AEP8_SARSC|nr:hypothetical protein QR98_0079920 [Sarcoptes scabiei]